MSLEVYRAHQRTMRAFLDSQGQVMARLLSLEKALKIWRTNGSFLLRYNRTALPAFVPHSPREEMPDRQWADIIRPRGRPSPNVETNPGWAASFWLFRALAEIRRIP